jgi:hypothetical protein
MSNLYRGPSIDASYQVSVHLAKRFQRRFLKIGNSENCLWRPCLSMDQDKLSNFYRGPSVVASYQISVHLGKRFQSRRFFRNQPINQRLPWACNRSPGSKLLSITTQPHCGGHLGGRARLPNTILEKDHPMTIPSKFGSNWATGSRQDGFYVNFPYGPMLN